MGRQEKGLLGCLVTKEGTMAESENYKKGTEIRRKLMGEKYADRMNKTVYDDPMMKKFGDYAREAVFGMLWSRPGLDMKTRALICVISDTAQARWPELAIHLRMARNQGWTEDELSEALMHLSGYIGLPSVREAMLTAKEVFAEMRKE
jgi:4-carboxymuconolactone decarboxylase